MVTRERSCSYKFAVFSRDSHGAPAISVNAIDNLFIDRGAKNHFNNIHGLFVSDAHSADESRLNAKTI